ncbi:ABC transporter permease [Vallitalea pronyensis]|uniref:Transport permease protein n=1 Tax=Vallitalea pronyensis TaxID=1348613 RepID=A0A8J8MHN2_9FIRM|nr:ABC transporter permease [Vallitalea pronyensis]QUI21784.1 ABC transporter permease [Vallitalea pronyensis]
MRVFKELYPIIWDEWVIFKRNFMKITISAIISPLLYMIAFGLGIGGGYSLSGVTYMKFLIPGIVALTTMNASYKAISVKLITNRVYDQTFEQYLIAPISIFSFCIGKAIAGALRGMYAGMLVLSIAAVFGISLNVTGSFLLLMFLNGLTFASLGMLGALVAKSHADMNRFGSYVILPMTFLCGTFFSTDYLPDFMRKVIHLLPLTHMSTMLRAIATYDTYYVANILGVVVYCIIFLTMSYRICLKIAT